MCAMCSVRPNSMAVLGQNPICPKHRLTLFERDSWRCPEPGCTETGIYEEPWQPTPQRSDLEPPMFTMEQRRTQKRPAPTVSDARKTVRRSGEAATAPAQGSLRDHFSTAAPGMGPEAEGSSARVDLEQGIPETATADMAAAASLQPEVPRTPEENAPESDTSDSRLSLQRAHQLVGGALNAGLLAEQLQRAAYDRMHEDDQESCSSQALHTLAAADAKNVVDQLAIARAILPDISPYFSIPEGDFKGYPPIECWDEKTLGWKRSGGERPLILAIEAALKKHFGEGASGKWQGSEDPRNGNTSFLKGIREALTYVLPPHPTPLDDEQRTAPLLHFTCGRTLDLSQPFDKQLRWGQVEDRSCRSTGKCFEELHAETRQAIMEVCGDINGLCAKGVNFELDENPTQDVQELLARDRELMETCAEIRSRLEALREKSELLQYLYPSHKSWDTTIYELRQWTRAAGGYLALEEFLVYLGKRGSNRKTTTIKLLLKAFGSSTKSGGQGYVCIQKAAYFQQRACGKPNAPDEGVAAMKGAKFVVVDEFAKDHPDFNGKLVKQWSDTDGTPLPFERKFGAREEVCVSWLMMWFCNHLPNLRDADEAVARRLSVIPMTVQFKAQEDIEEGNHNHSLADNSWRSRVQVLSAELIFWIRCLSPGVREGRKDTTILRPRPASVEAATEEELEVLELKGGGEAASDDPRCVRIWIERFIRACGRGEAATRTADVHESLKNYLGKSTRDCSQILSDAGFTAKAVNRGGKKSWGYVYQGKPQRLL